jgi:hypothetical protein
LRAVSTAARSSLSAALAGGCPAAAVAATVRMEAKINGIEHWRNVIRPMSITLAAPDWTRQDAAGLGAV